MIYIATEQETKTIRDAQAGCQVATNTILNNYSYIVHRVAKSYFLLGSDIEDLIQEGMIGLYKALRDYQENKGSPFKTFAELCVKRQVITAIKTYNRVKHRPLNNYTSIYKPIYDDSQTALIEYLPNKGVNPETNLIKKELFDDLGEFINIYLSDLEKKVLILYLSGLSYKDISSTLKVKNKTTDNTMWRIRKKFRNSEFYRNMFV